MSESGEATRLWHVYDGGTLRAVAFIDDGMWVIQGLEQDICTQGRSLNEAISRFGLCVEEERFLRDFVLTSIAPAPQQFYDMWDSLAPPLPASKG